MDNNPTTQRRIRRLVKVLHSHGWYYRQDVLDAFDTRADFSAIDGVGPVLAKTLAALLQLTDEEWAVVTGLANSKGAEGALQSPPQKA